MKKLLARIRMLLRNRKLRRFWTRCISTVAAVVVFATTYALVLPAITMESEAACGKQAHQHIDSCYEKRLICQLQESDDHHHTESCYEKVLVCGIEPHIHSKECYKEDSSAVAATGQTSAGAQILETAGAENWSGEDAYGSAAEAAGTSDNAADAHAELDSDSMDEAALFENGEDLAGESEADFAEDASGASESDLAKNTTDGSGADFEENPAGGSETDRTENPDSDPGTDFAEGASDGAETAFEEGGSDESGTDFAEGTSDGSATDFAEDTAGGTGTDNAGATTDDSAAAGAQDPAQDTAADPSQTTPAAQEEPAAAGTTDVLPEELANAEESLSDGYVPQLEELCFPALLTEETGFYYYHIGEKDEIPGTSADITEWKKVNDDTQLAPTDLVKAWLSYTIPAGALNETNQIARYRLPANLHLTDDQILAINSAENGIALQADRSTEDGENEYLKYLGAEAIEGTRTPDQDLIEGTQEYISAAVKAENIYENTLDENGNYVAPDGSIASDQGACIGQDLIFIFSPYTIEKNQITYDKKGKPVTKGEAVRGWFAMDFNMEQIDWAEKETDLDNSTIEKSADVIFAAADEEQKIEEISETLNLTEKDPAIADTESENDKAPENAASGEQNDKADEEAKDASEHETADSNDKNDSEEERTSAPDEETAESEDQTKTSDEAESEDDEEESDGTLPAEDEKVTYKAGTLTAEGDSYKVTLDYTENAGIPENAFLSVREITAETDPEAYESCLETARQQVKSSEQTEKQKVDDKASRFFDIEILVEKTGEDGSPVQEKIEPSAPVNVNIQLMEAPVPTTAPESAEGNAPAQPADPTILHFAKDGVEQLEATMNTPQPHDGTVSEDNSVSDAPAAEIRFEAESFSIYGVVYTVDFEYDGYMISIPGNSSVLLSSLAAELSLPGADGTGYFDISQVENITFSDDSLVRVSKVENTMTVDELLSQLEQEGVLTWLAQNVVVRTEDKSDDEILAEANSIGQVDPDAKVYAGDWLLTGLQAFHTDEKLVITLKTGEKYVVNVTDLDTATNGVKPGTVTGYDSASAGITITMFDYGPDKLDNVNNTYNSTDNSGINSGHDLKFYSYGTEGTTINNFTGGAYAMQGVVKSGLVNDYPVTSKSGENLSYLFNNTPSGNNKKVYENVNGLFLYDDDTGLMHYSSDDNYAYMNPNPNSSGGYDFTLYNNTYTEEGADYANPFRIGFFPYNDYDNRYRCIHGDNFYWGCKGQNDRRVRDQVGHYNHHFGMKVEGTFYMTDDKKTPKGNQDMIFEFSGDDDMWVFIDGVLVLDIGGIHNPVDGKINFTTGEVTVSAAKTASGGSSYALGTNTTIAAAFEKYNANKAAADPVKTWDDSPLSHHDIKIFYMERGGMYSNLEISMNLPTFPAPKHVQLWKVNQANENEKLAGAQFELYSDFACTKPIKATGSDSPVIITSATDPWGSVLVNNLVPGQTYYLKEIKAPDGGYKLDNRVFKIVAPPNDDSSEAEIYIATSATEVEQLPNHNIPNTKDTYGSFDFFKVKEEDPNTKISGAQFTLYTDMDCTTIAKNKTGQNLQVTSDSNGSVNFADIPAGKTYYMKETAEPSDYFPSSDVYTVEVAADGKVTVKLGTEVKFTSDSNTPPRQITNKPKTQDTSISVDKRWKDGAANHTNDTVTVQLYKLETNSTSVKVNWGGKDPGSGAKVTVTFSAEGYDAVTVELEATDVDYDWTENADLVKGVTYNVTTTWSGDEVESVTGSNETFTAVPGGIYVLTGTLKATLIDVPVTITWPEGTTIPEGTTVKVEIKDTDRTAPDDHEVNLPIGTNWSSSEELTEGKTYTINYVCSDGVSVTGTESLTVTSGSQINATGTVSNGKMNLKIVYVPNVTVGHNAYGVDNFIGLKSNGDPDWDTTYSGTWDESSLTYTINNIDIPDGIGDGYAYCFSPNTGWAWNNAITARATDGLSATRGSRDGNVIIKVGAKPGTYTVYLLDEGMSVPSSLSFTSASGRSSNRLVKNAPLRAAVPADNFLNGTHELPAGAVPVPGKDPVVLNEAHDGRWSYTWTDLPAESEGTKTSYYVVETEVNLANGDNSDVVTSTYDYIYNVEGDETSGIKTVIITNEVQPKTSLDVTKRWLNPDGSQSDDHYDITFVVHQVVGDQDTVYPDSNTTHTITYDNSKNAYNTVTVSNLPTKKKDGDELKDAFYYVVETSPEGRDDLTTYYEAGGKQYADPADVGAAGATSVTIVNKNVSREITVTKEWRYKNGSRVTVASEPPERDVYFKLKKIVDGQNAEYFTIQDSAGVPESDTNPSDYTSYSNAGGNGTIYHLICTSTTTEHVSELDPTKTYTTTSWAWNTLTFNNLPTGCKYILVETDSEGRELLSDAVGTQITYVDENGKLMNETSPIDPAIPGNYTIRNTEHRTSLYAQKVWQGANKDNLAGNESVWFSLMRVETDGNGDYKWDTLEETPGVGRFALKESSGWVKYFDSIEVAPPERHANDTYKYYQYFIVELGLLDESTATEEDDEKTYSLINNLYIRYQSKGSGTAADGSVATGRDEFLPYSQGVDLAADDGVTGSKTVDDWITALKADTTLESSFVENNMIQLRTWEDKYDGMGTLGAFNSSQEFLEQPLDITKVWKDAEGNELTDTDKNKINATGDGDHYQVEIQLMQHAYNLGGDASSQTYDVPYGSTFMVDPTKVIMQSDLFEVSKKGDDLWAFKIPATNTAGEYQLPLTGPFRIPGSGETVQASFEYYVAEYRVYNNEGNDETTLWSAACKKNASGSTYSLELENRKTTDLVLHKSWKDVPEENRTWVNDNVQAVLFKVWRKAPDEAEATDITEYIAARPRSYDLTSANVFDVELDSVYEDFVRIDKPADGWAITDDGSADAAVTINNLDALVKDYLTDQATDSDLSNWPKYQYWVEEWGYVDAKGSFQFIETLLHGNTKSSADYPKYQQSIGSSTVTLTAGGTPGYGSSAADAKKPAATTIGKSAEISLGTAGQNHLGAVNTVRGLELTIIKTDNSVIPKKLTNAQFVLKHKDPDGSWRAFTYSADTDADASTDDVTVTTEDGKFTITAENGYIIKNLMPGQYKLEEVKSPDGYIIQFRPVEFEVTSDGKIVAPGTTTELAGGVDKHFTYVAGTTTGKSSGSISVQNEPGAELPSTGGSGTHLFYILGAMLTAVALVLLARRRKV